MFNRFKVIHNWLLLFIPTSKALKRITRQRERETEGERAHLLAEPSAELLFSRFYFHLLRLYTDFLFSLSSFQMHRYNRWCR